MNTNLTSIVLKSLASLALVSNVQGMIVEDGLWTGKDYYKTNEKIGVQNGVPYSNDPEMNRKIRAATSVNGDVSDYRSRPNVQRVMRLVDEDDWEELFPIRNDLYEYEGFLRAVGKFGAFCSEGNLDGYDAD